jgi:type VI secretion system secreted protein VgrG
MMELNDLKSGMPSIPSADGLKSGASSALSSAKDAAGGLVGNAADAAGKLAGNAGDLAGKALGAASGYAKDALGKAGGALGSLGGKLGVPLGELLSLDATPFIQNARLLKLQLFEDGQLTDRLPAQRAEGEEALSKPYKIEVTCQSPESGIELKHLIGLPAQIGILTAQAGGLPGIAGLGWQEEERESAEEVIRCGIVTAARALGADGGFARYQLTIEPPLTLLRQQRKSRVFQDISVPDIVKTILDEHLAGNPAFAKTFAHRFDLTGTYPPRSYCLQYRESELDFIERLLAEEGIGYRFEHTGGQTDAQADEESAEEEDEEDETETPIPLVTFIAFDDPWKLPQAAQGEIRFHRAEATEAEDSLTEWTGQRQIGPGSVSLIAFDYKLAATDNAARFAATDQGEAGGMEEHLEDYDPQTLYYASQEEGLDHYAKLRQQAHDRHKKTFFGQGNVRELRAGEWFTLTEHPDYDPDFEEDAQFTVTRLAFTATNNLPGEDKEEKDERPYRVKIEAQRKGIPLVPDFAHTSHAKPVAHGTQTALVVGPANEEVYTDELGRIKIQFHWQRPEEHPERGARFDETSSCWIRVAYPSAGAAWGHQFIPRIGQEVVVAFLEDDIDRPLVIGVVYDGRQPPPWFSGAGHLPANKTLSGIQTKEHFGVGYNELLFDDTPGEVRAKFSSEPGKSQLNLGWLAHPRSDGEAEPRGEGFELRSDFSGALRAARGLLLSAHGRRLAAGGQLDRQELIAQLETALAIARALGEDADKHDAEGTETKPQEQLTEHVKQWEAGSNTDQAGGDPNGKGIAALTAPEGMALASEANLLLVSGASQDFVAAQDANHSVGQNLRQRVGRAFSLFVQQAGMKLIAAAGKIIVRALSDEIEIAAAKKLHLFSQEEIVLDAPKITLRAQGAGVEYGGGAITSRTTGAHTRHAASHADVGPASVTPEGELNATQERFDQKVRLYWQGGQTPVANRRYRLHLENGGVLEGVTDPEGHTQHFQSELGFARYKVELLPNT